MGTVGNIDNIIKLTDTLSRVEKNLNEEMEILEFVLDTITDGYWDLHIPNGYQYLSSKYKEMLGYGVNEMENAPSAWMAIIDKVDLKITLDNFNKHVDTNGEHPFDQVVTYTHKLGHKIKIRCTGSIVSWNKDGTPLRMVGIHQLIKGEQ